MTAAAAAATGGATAQRTDACTRRAEGVCSKGSAAAAMDWAMIALRILTIATCALGHPKGHVELHPEELDQAMSRSPMEKAVAIAYVATGPVAREVFLPLSLNNLRRAGGWRGYVFVLTDDSNCVPKDLATPVVLPLSPPGIGEYNLSNYGKQVKVLLLQLLPLRTEHNYVLYLDVDVFIGRPVGPFLLSATRDADAAGATISLFREGTGKNGQANHSATFEPLYRKSLKSTKQRALIKAQLDAQPCNRNFSLYHSGIFLVARTNGSAACLARWAEWADTPCHWDQPFLTRAVMAGDCRVNVLSPYDLGQPTKANRGTYLTFNHFHENLEDAR
eukprot:6197413-Pleurochrysis_carterae.AAC.1